MLEILYHDDLLVAVHKPPGLMVHRSELSRRETRFAVQLLRKQLGRRVFPAHRLDRGTSGVLLFAFEPDVAARLGEAFAARAVRKRYLAVVRGWPEPSGSIEHALRRLEDGKDTADAHAPRQEARTDYRLLASAEVPIPSRHHDTTRVALVELQPRTGRQHQIRRHLKHISHPVLGDATYGKGPLNRAFAGLFGTGRLLLACTDLHLAHPADGGPLRLQAPLEPGFAALCARLGWEGVARPAGTTLCPRDPVALVALQEDRVDVEDDVAHPEERGRAVPADADRVSEKARPARNQAPVGVSAGGEAPAGRLDPKAAPQK